MTKMLGNTDRLVEAVEHLSEDMRDLTEALEQGTLLRVAEEIQTLRSAVDDLRQEIEWKARNVTEPDDWVAHSTPITSLPRDPCDREFAQRIDGVDTNSLRPAQENGAATSPHNEEADDSTVEIKADEDKQEVNAHAPTQPLRPPMKKRSKQKQPLYLRMYAQRDIADVVRLIGYQRHDWQEFRPRLTPLIEKYGEAAIEATTEELVEVSQVDGTAWVVLKPAVRELARQLLGRPPEDTSR